MSVFSERLKECRKKSGKLQDEVAAGLGIKKNTYSTYETGRSSPALEFIPEIADYFGVSADYLLGRTDNPEPESEPEIDTEDIEVLAASSAIPINEWSDEKKRELLKYAKYLNSLDDNDD